MEGPLQRIRTYRKAAWAVGDLEQDIGLVYRMMGVKGLQVIPEVGPPVGKRVETILKDLSARQVR